MERLSVNYPTRLSVQQVRFVEWTQLELSAALHGSGVCKCAHERAPVQQPGRSSWYNWTDKLNLISDSHPRTLRSLVPAAESLKIDNRIVQHEVRQHKTGNKKCWTDFLCRENAATPDLSCSWCDNIASNRHNLAFGKKLNPFYANWNIRRLGHWLN